MKRVRLWAGGVAILLLVSGNFAGAKPEELLYPLILEQAGGPVSVGASYAKKNDARAAGRALEEATEGLSVTVSPANLVGEDNGSGIVYPLLVELANGENFVPKAYTDINAARNAALNLGIGDNTWVFINPSPLRGKHEALSALLLRGLIPSPTLLAETVLDGTVNSLITLPTIARTGLLTSPDVRFTTQFENVLFTLFLPVDADWNNPANSISLLIEYSNDSGATWNYMCSSFNQYGIGRGLNKDGTPNTGGSTSCSNRDGNNVLRPVTTWYHMKVTITGTMTAGGEVRLSSQT